MDSLNDLILKAIERPHDLTGEDISSLRRIARDYPSSAVAPALLLKYASASLSDDEREEMRTRVALGGFSRQFISMIDPSGREFTSFYPPEPELKRPTTENAIDKFLETYGHASPEEDALLERMIFNPVPDYSEQLAREEAGAATPTPVSGDWQGELIDAFLQSQGMNTSVTSNLVEEERPSVKPEKSEKAVPKTPEPGNSTLFSESLAKIFIKQGRFDRAYEIITNLSLNYPEKSIYFADQLRFLEKLMINQSYSKDK